MHQPRPHWHMKTVPYSFSGSIPAKFKHKLRRHKQTVGKITTTVVLDKDENLGLQWHRSCYSNEMKPLPIILAAIFLSGNCSSKIDHRSFFLQYGRLDVREVKTESVRALSRYFGIKFFIVRNTVKKGKSWCLAVICRKRCAFDMQFHLIVASIFLKTWVIDHGDSSGQLLQRRTILEEQFPERNIAASIIGNGFISLL